MRPIKKDSLAKRLADQLEQDILQGIWKDQLPGRSVMAQHYEVSVKTYLAALAILQAAGHISATTRGRPFQILTKADSQARSQQQHNLILIHTSRAPLTAEHASLLHEIQTYWESHAGTATKVALDYKNLGNADKRIADIIHRHSANAAVLLNAPLAISGECYQRIPTFQIGGLHPDTPKLSAIGCGFATEIERFARLLIQWGHRRILIPVYDETSHPICLSGLKAAYDDSPPPEDIEQLLPVFFSSHPDAWKKFWKDTLSSLEPTAVIVMDDVRLLSLYSFCQQAGIRIPRDLSVILFSYNPKLEWVSPRPTMGVTPTQKMLAQFKHWFETHYKPTGSKTFPLDHLWGESISRI